MTRNIISWCYIIWLFVVIWGVGLDLIVLFSSLPMPIVFTMYYKEENRYILFPFQVSLTGNRLVVTLARISEPKSLQYSMCHYM